MTFPTDQLVKWSEFTIRNTLDTSLTDVIENRELSSKALNMLLQNSRYNMYTDKGKIGYLTPDSAESYTYGMTEAEAYSDWVIDLKKKEKSFKNAMPANRLLTQAQYDGLVAFYYVTNQINKVVTVNGTYELREQILAGEWETVASMILRDRRDFNLNRKAGTVIVLGDYGRLLGRSWLRNQGLQRLRRNYLSIVDGYQKRQAEHSYYRETQKFLPGMSEMRQREVVNYYRSTL